MIHYNQTPPSDLYLVQTMKQYNQTTKPPSDLYLVQTMIHYNQTPPSDLYLVQTMIHYNQTSPSDLYLVQTMIHYNQTPPLPQIRYSPMSGESYSYVMTSELKFHLVDLDPGTSYELSVKAVRGNSSSQWSLPVLNSTQQTSE